MASPKLLPALLFRISRPASIRSLNAAFANQVYTQVFEKQRRQVWQVSTLVCHEQRRRLSQQSGASKLYNFEDVSYTPLTLSISQGYLAN